MNKSIFDLSSSKWCEDIRLLFQQSSTAFRDFATNPASTLQELGFDDEIELSDGAKAKVSSVIASLTPLEANQLIQHVRPLTYRAGDGSSDPAPGGDESAGIVSAVAVASNVAVVGEVAVALAAVVVAVYGGALDCDQEAIQLSALAGISFSDDFAKSEAYEYLDGQGLSDNRKKALLKQRLVASKAHTGRVETDLLGQPVWLDVSRTTAGLSVDRAGML